MLVGKVIGDIWSTRKEESLRGPKFLVVRPLDLLEGGKPGAPIVTVNGIDAGIGETVLIANGSSARTTVRRPDAPMDATVVGIIDDRGINTNVL